VLLGGSPGSRSDPVLKTPDQVSHLHSTCLRLGIVNRARIPQSEGRRSKPHPCRIAIAVKEFKAGIVDFGCPWKGKIGERFHIYRMLLRLRCSAVAIEASQIAKLHLVNRNLQDEGGVRNGKHIVGAVSTFHYLGDHLNQMGDPPALPGWQ
jgi:hypothetical protein